MTVSADPVEAYHTLLTDELAQDSSAQLDEQLRLRGLFFGDRPLCNVLRPRFFTPAQWAMLQARSAVVLRAFRKVHRAALADDTVLDQLRLVDWERSLVGVDPGFREASPVSRLDAFFVGDDGLAFTEYNAETPAGGAYNDALCEMFFAIPAMRRFMRDWDARPLAARHNVLQALLDCWEQFSGGRSKPRIAIVDWDEVPTQSEFRLFHDYFTRQGYECDIVAPASLEYTGGVLRSPAGRVDVIYKRVLLSELVERGGIDHPILRAVRDRRVCMVNPPSCKILHKKASLAVLSDERNARLFDAQELRQIEATIPWTRVVEERRTIHDGREVDLLDEALAHREQLVLKPNDEYGGKGIVLGWEVSDDVWRDALASALEEPYIVQQRIPLPTESYPSLVEGRLHFADRMVDTAPYVAEHGHLDGCLSRLGTASLLNVTAGTGTQTPSFVVERR
ncbi:MAG: circularly permuted type 2 ATP-grasp protein [Gemmatimonadaceae bacterium]|nr:circularly permuted type 2 ATP-grasp protein [Gemmatimonadaceae bacterium]